MWPFDYFFSSDDGEECDHEWDEYATVMTHPNNIYHTDEGINETTNPYIHRVIIHQKECDNCGEIETIDTREDKLYLSVERVEPVE